MRGRTLIVGICLILFLCCFTVSAQDPPECTLIPTNAAIPAGLSGFCVKDPMFTYDLSIVKWDPLTYISEDLRVGYDWIMTPPDTNPRFMFFKDASNNYRFYTWLYSKFRNQSGSIACPDSPSAAQGVRVQFSYTESNDPLAVDNPATVWTPIGSEYIMKIPGGDGVLYGGQEHQQQYPICWILNAGDRFPAQFIVKAEVFWQYEDGADELDDNVAYSMFDLTSQKNEAHIALALDLSGSMSGIMPGDTNSKLTLAQEKAGMFVSLVEDNQYIGVYGFATSNPNNTSFTANYKDLNDIVYTPSLGDTSQISAMQRIPDDGTGDFTRGFIAGQISSTTYHGCTPVGQGLLRAKDGIDSITSTSPLPKSKAIILFSDGLQNIQPYINSDPGYSCGGSAFDIIDAEKTFADNDIPIYSIYFGPESGWAYDLMNDIKDQTGGDYVYGAATELELATVYFTIRGMVDDMIYLKKDGVTGNGGVSDIFTVQLDGAADKATAVVAWELGDGNNRMTIEYRKKGGTAWQSCLLTPTQIDTPTDLRRNRMSTTVGMTAYQPAIPGSGRSYKVCRFTAGPNSTWEFRVRDLASDLGGKTFAAAVFSNVETAAIKASLDDTGFEAGKAMPVYVDLTSMGHAVGEATVTARVRVPARSFSSMLRGYMGQFLPATDPDSHKVSSMATQMQRFLKRDTGSSDLYVYREVPLTLKDDGKGPDKMVGDGRYSALLPASDTHISGHYEITFRAKGKLSGGRPFERSLMLSTICNTGAIDPSKSVVEMSISSPRKDGKRIANISILPTDRFGNAAFPGISGDIRVIATSGTLYGGVKDNLDSSYTQLLVLEPGQTAKVIVIVDGVKLEMVDTVKPMLRRELSLHGGYALPEGWLNKVLDSGPALSLDFGYRFNHNFSLRGALSLNWFNNPFIGNLLLSHINGYFQYRTLSGRWVPYFETGVGFYKLEDSDSAFGYSGGIGTRYILTRQWDLDFSLHGHRVGGDLDLSFLQVLAGFIFKF